MHYLLFYDVEEDYITRRAPLRPAHLAYARPFVDRGELLLGAHSPNRPMRPSFSFRPTHRVWPRHSPEPIRM